MPSILHYTEPGDIVLDGFNGSGMTGIAAQWCGSPPQDYREKLEQKWKAEGYDAPKWGLRHCVLNDLSPAATFIAANYNLPFDVEAFFRLPPKNCLEDVEKEIAWMYETLHTDGKTKGRIEYTVWSELFTCPDCSGEVVFLDESDRRFAISRSVTVKPISPLRRCTTVRGLLQRALLTSTISFFLVPHKRLVPCGERLKHIPTPAFGTC